MRHTRIVVLLAVAVATGRFTAAASRFTATGLLTTPRAAHTATLLPDGKVLVAGGTNELEYLNSAEVYDRDRGTFTPVRTNMTSRREDHTATLLLNGKVLIAGGYDGSHAISAAELYDPASGTFTPVSPMTSARNNHTATLLPDGKVLIAGGYDASVHLSNTAELFDPATGTFTATNTPMTSRRAMHTGTLLPDGNVLIAGGLDGSLTLVPTAEVYQSASRTFVATSGPMTGIRNTATRLNDGTVLLAGGFRSVSTADSAELYAAGTGTFSPANGHLNAARESHTATLLPNGQVLLGGGYESAGHVTYQTQAELYDPDSGTFVATSARMLEERYQHTATCLSSGKVLIVGGYSGTSAGYPVNTAEVFELSITPFVKRRAAGR